MGIILSCVSLLCSCGELGIQCLHLVVVTPLKKITKCMLKCCNSTGGNKTATYLDSYDIDWEASPLKDPGQHVVINVEEYDM